MTWEDSTEAMLCAQEDSGVIGYAFAWERGCVVLDQTEQLRTYRDFAPFEDLLFFHLLRLIEDDTSALLWLVMLQSFFI